MYGLHTLCTVILYLADVSSYSLSTISSVVLFRSNIAIIITFSDL